MTIRDWLIGIAAGLLGICCARADSEGCKSLQQADDVVQQVCATCHIVARNQKIAPSLEEPAPSFFDIAARPGTTADSLHRFLETTHWDRTTFPMTMPRLRLSEEQIDAIACYILSLRPKP